MAERIHDPPEPEGYPWDDWTDGDTWRVVHGEDFQCDTASLQTYLYRVARRRKMIVTTKRDGDTIVFKFRRDSTWA